MEQYANIKWCENIPISRCEGIMGTGKRGDAPSDFTVIGKGIYIELSL